MHISSLLIIEQAPNYELGDIITLKNKETTFGRESLHWKPHITFNNVFVSRKHFIIFNEELNFYIKDLDSKHGTFINGSRLKPNTAKKLQSNDKISFAKDLVVMTFSVKDFEETSELSSVQLEELHRKSLTPHLDPLKQRLFLQNKSCALSEKEYKFIELLLQRNQFVSKEEIIKYVWSERASSLELVPLVSSEEVNALIYRLRKKIPTNIAIETIRGKGYSLTLEAEDSLQ